MCTSLGQTLRYTQVSCKHDLYLLNMNIDLKRIALLVGTCVLLASCHATPAHDKTGTESFVKVAATLRAGAEVCNTYTRAELDELREQQRKTVAEMGMHPERFDEVFESRYQEARAMLAETTQSEMNEICEDVEGFPIDQWR